MNPAILRTTISAQRAIGTTTLGESETPLSHGALILVLVDPSVVTTVGGQAPAVSVSRLSALRCGRCEDGSLTLGSASAAKGLAILQVSDIR